MACATLKRALDWESMNQRPPKRRRCNPFGQAGSNAGTASPSRDRDGPSTSAGLPHTPSNRFAKDNTEPSPFSEASLAKMSPGEIIKIRNGLKPLYLVRLNYH